ncbi:uncharacterized protein LOC144110361 [Amblyomma americanum]
MGNADQVAVAADPVAPATGVRAPHYETDEMSQQSYPGNGQGGYYESAAGMGGAGALMDGLMAAMQNLQLPAGAIQPGSSSPNSPSLRPPTPPPGTTSANKPSLPPKPAGNLVSTTAFATSAQACGKRTVSTTTSPTSSPTAFKSYSCRTPHQG